MALSASTVLEVRLTGDDTNGGGFVTGASGTDWSLQNAAQYSVTDGVTAGSTTVTSATANFGTDVVGNLVYVAGGTGSVVAGWYQIISRTNATTIVVDRATGLTAGTGVTLKIGGALASPGQAGAIATVSGMVTFVKYNASAYVITTASTNVPGGCVLGTNVTMYVGYDTTRTTINFDANRPTIQLNTGVSAATIFTTIGTVANLILDGNLQTTSRGTSGVTTFRCHFLKFTNGASSGNVLYCSATLCTTIAVFSGAAYFCDSYANTNVVSFSGQAIYCKAYANTGSSAHGFTSYAYHCVAHGNGGVGFRTAAAGIWAANCIAESNTSFGFDGQNTRPWFVKCAAFGNSSRLATSSPASNDIDPINGAGSFFVNAAAGNFALNNTAGAGALARAAGLSPSPDGLTTIYQDVGAAQHQDAGGSTVSLGHGNLSGGMQ